MSVSFDKHHHFSYNAKQFVTGQSIEKVKLTINNKNNKQQKN